MFFPDKTPRIEQVTLDDAMLIKSPIIELEITKGRKIDAKLVSVGIRQIRLNPNNPRIRHRSFSSREDDLEDALWHEEGTKNLFSEIRYSGGLSEKPIVDSNLFVIEGNRRIVCLRRLDDLAKNGELPDYPEASFEKVQALMLPADVNPKDLELLLARVHVSGKKEWSPLDQAEQIFDMVSKHSMPTREVANALSISPQRIAVMFEAFRATQTYGAMFPDDEGKWIHKFSYFFELYRRRQLRAWVSEEKNLATFMELISGEKPKLWLGSQVRDLMEIIADPIAYGMLLAHGYEKAIEAVKKKQSKNDPHTVALKQAADTLLDLIHEPGKLSKYPGTTKVLKDIQQKVDYILSTKTPHSARNSKQ